jgi:hypothetical protein
LYSCTTTSGFTCTAGATATSNPPANAISVTQTAKVSTFFAEIFGIPYVSVTATSTAMAAYGVPKQVNVALILDTTKSMASPAVGPALASCPVATYPTAEDCALRGVQAILGGLWPCAQGVTCPATPAVDEVAVFIFPGVTSVPASYHCSATLTPVPYNNSPAPVYEIVPFAADYRTSDTATAVVDGVAGGNASSNLVKCVAPVSVTTSLGNSANTSWEGGEGTYYAGAITAAQASFAGLGRPGATNVIILLTDGNAGAATGGTKQCQAAVTAAWAAATAGTSVYAVYYDDNGTTGTCSTDTGSYTGSSPKGACYTLQQIASSPSAKPDPTKFYSTDGTSAASGSCPSSYAYTNIATIFTNIGNSLLTARLIPNP